MEKDGMEKEKNITVDFLTKLYYLMENIKKKKKMEKVWNITIIMN